MFYASAREKKIFFPFKCEAHDISPPQPILTFLATINFSHQSDSSTVLGTHLAAHFTHFSILASIQIMNFQCVLALSCLLLPLAPHIFRKEIYKCFFFSFGYRFEKHNRQRRKKKECFVWPLNRFRVGRIINNRTVKTTH